MKRLGSTRKSYRGEDMLSSLQLNKDLSGKESLLFASFTYPLWNWTR